MQKSSVKHESKANLAKRVGSSHLDLSVSPLHLTPTMGAQTSESLKKDVKVWKLHLAVLGSDMPNVRL